MDVILRSMTEEDWSKVFEIYEQGIETGDATFEQSVPGREEWDKSHCETCRLVAVADNEIAGWAALSPVSSRDVYKGVAEVSIYVGNEFKGRKIGTRLLKELIKVSETNNYRTLQASVFEENKASLKLFTASGFRIVGVREKIGKMNGVWRDTILLERRSKNI